MPQSLGALIRERREALGLTQEQLAERVGEGVRQSEISRLEHDRISLPRRDRLGQIAAALDLTIGDLLVLTGWMADEHRSFLNDDGEPHPDDGAQVSQEVLAAAVEALTAARHMMIETTGLLDAAERNLARAMQDRKPGVERQAIGNRHLGVIKDHESAVSFRG